VLLNNKTFRIFTKTQLQTVFFTSSETMEESNNKNYPPEDVKIARFAKALGHPVRIAILRHLASLETCRFTDISNELSLANSTVFQHLAELKRAGLIQGCIEPPKLQYCINYENWQLLRKHFKEIVQIKVVKYEKDKQMLLK